MRYAYAVADVRSAERELMARLPEGTLMQRAAFGLATIAAGMLRGEAGSVYGSRVALLVGVGDNGGDALYAGALLAGRGVTVHAVLADPARAHAEGLIALREAGGRVVLAHEAEPVLLRADLIMDGLLGIGGSGGLRGTFAELAALAHSAAQVSGAPIVAVDLPSGVDADTGEVAGAAVQADVTVTFGTHKPGLFLDPGAGNAGVIEFVDIGLEFPPSVAPVLENLQEEDVRALLPEPSRSSHKLNRGVVGLAVGSERYPGAALLAVGAAQRSGVGSVRYNGPVDVVHTHPEVVNGMGKVQAWVVGSGLGRDEDAQRRLHEVLDTDLPVVVDADGLRMLPQKALGRSAPTILTPHSGEAAQLLGVTAAEIDGQRLASVLRLAELYDATVLLKGTLTLICDPPSTTVNARAFSTVNARAFSTVNARAFSTVNARAFSTARVNTHASPVLATAGSGDVLAGLIGGLLAGGLSAYDAASVGAYVHGAAGLLAARSGPVAAGDLVATLPLAWQNIQE